MTSLIEPIAEAWIGRSRQVDRGALDAVAGQSPAAVITGGSRGLGLALAGEFAGSGAPVLLVARDESVLEAAAAALAARHPGRVLQLALDVTAPDALQRLEGALSAKGLYCDTLVNAAGIGLAGPFTAHTPEDIERLLALNVTALSCLVRWALPAMLARGRGGILNVASLGAYVPGPNQAAYYASKSYVVSLTEAIAAEAMGRGVRVAVVSPGPLETGFHAAMGAERSLYRQVLPSMSPERAARLAFRSYRLGRKVIVPGALATVSSLVLRLTPHPVSLPLVKLLLRRP